MNDLEMMYEENRIMDAYILQQRLRVLEDLIHYNFTYRLGDIYDLWLKKFNEHMANLNEIIKSDIENHIKNKESDLEKN